MRLPFWWSSAVFALLAGPPAAPPIDWSTASASPDGRWITAISRDTLWVIGTEGGVPRALLGGVGAEGRKQFPFFAWSPDGARLIILRGGRVPTVVDPGTGRHEPLRGFEADTGFVYFSHLYVGSPAWHPDGRRLAFLARRRDDPPRMQLHIVDRVNGSIHRVTNDTTIDQLGAAWSPDGRQLMSAEGTFGGTRGRLVLRDADAPERVLAERRDGVPGYLTPLWSPTGTEVAVATIGRGTRRMAVDTVGPWSTPSTQLPAGRYVAWSADGRALLGDFRTGRMELRAGRLDLASGQRTLTTGADTSARTLGRRGEETLLLLERGTLPPSVWLAGAARRRLTPVEATPVRTAEVLSWTSVAGDSLDAQVLRPVRSRGVVVVPYGGYQNTAPRRDDFFDRLLLALVADGWTVVRPNTRGAASAQQAEGYGAWQLADTDRLFAAHGARLGAAGSPVAVLGHSHGGAMAYYYATHSARYCAAVAVNGRADWVLQAEHPYDGQLPDVMGASPAEDSARYVAASPVRNVTAGTPPLLAVAGRLDGQILPANAERMVAAMRRAGRPAELLLFEDEGHLVERAPNYARLEAAVRRLLGTRCR